MMLTQELDKLEVTALEYGIKSGRFTKDDFKDANLVTITINGRYKCKEIVVYIKDKNKIGIQYPFRFEGNTWETVIASFYNRLNQ